MKCRLCRVENTDGRENCVSCDRPLLDLHGVMARDQWVGKALRTCMFGGTAGAIIGAIVGFLAARQAGTLPAVFDGVWAGTWLGGVTLGLLTFLLAAVYYRLVNR